MIRRLSGDRPPILRTDQSVVRVADADVGGQVGYSSCNSGGDQCAKFFLVQSQPSTEDLSRMFAE